MINKTLADKLVDVACKQLEASINFKQPRLETIKKYEDAYNNKVAKPAVGEFNIPIPVLGGFVDTLMSKIDEAPKIRYGYTDLADYKKAKKVTAMWEKDSSSTQGKWARKDRNQKKLAIFSGFGADKLYSESDPKYKSNLHIVDYYSFHFEPNGGSDIDDHLFCGESDIFKSKSSLEDGAAAGLYNPAQVHLLTLSTSNDKYKVNQDKFKNKINRFASLGLDPEKNNYVGEELFSLVEWYMTYQGERYYLLFDPNTKIWVRAEALKDIFTDNLWPYTVWHTHEDPFNFLSKSPCDDIYPIHEAIRININAALTNLNKRNKGQTAYDPDVFTEAAMLEWRPNGLVPAFAKAAGRSMQESVYQFQTPDTTTITINLTEFFDSFIGRKTGITPESQGAGSSEDKVGIYYGNMQQVADRLGLYNKFYTEAYADKGLRYWHGLQEHLTEGEAVEILGTEGSEWAEIKKEDTTPYRDFQIKIIGSDAEMKQDAARNERRRLALEKITANPILINTVNPKWLAEEILRTGDYQDSEIKEAQDKDHYANKEILSEADCAIREVLSGKTPKKFRGANTAFIQRIVDYATDNELKQDQFDQLIEYSKLHLPIAMENMARKAALEVKAPMPAGMPPAGEPAAGEPPMPNSPAATASMSANLANAAVPTLPAR